MKPLNTKDIKDPDAKDFVRALGAGCSTAEAIGKGLVKSPRAELAAFAIVLLDAAARWVVSVERRLPR